MCPRMPQRRSRKSSPPPSNAALADPEVQTRFDKVGIVKPRATGPAFLQKYLSDEIEKWGDILRTTKDSD